VLSQRFAYEAMAQQSLGRHWKELTPAQQQAFIPLFSSLLEQMHTQHIEKYGGKKKSIVFKDETLHADGTASVHLVIVDPHDPTINEDMGYRLQKHQDTWLVHDIQIDGSSVITNFRTKFD
jgi:phospholipid transport system substrate-binding protein